MIYLLVVLVSIMSVDQNIQNEVHSEVFVDKTDCQITEGRILTQAMHDPKIVGWLMPDACREVGTIAKKA
jgi:hypothetical protein